MKTDGGISLRSPAGALVLGACLILTACRAAPPAAPPGAPPAGRARITAEPAVRVGILVDSPRAVVSSPTAFELVGTAGQVLGQGAPGSEWVVTADPAGALTAVQTGGNGRVGAVAGTLLLRPRQGGTVTIAGRPYRGTVLIAGAGGLVTAVNVLDIEAYLRGVVPFEIGHRPPGDIEAVKAQAVAARTYAVGGLGKRRAFDFYATVMDQVYGGLSGEDSVSTRAVEETRGEIVTYQDQPIQAYYHSTCGGQTAAIEESWPWRAPQPYLRSVSDRIPGSDRAYCDLSGRYRWRTTWTAAQLRATLSAALAMLGGHGTVRDVQDIRILSRWPSGRVDSLQLRLDGRDYIVRADSLRWALRTPQGALLNSSLLVDATLHAPGDTVALEVHGGGWGHGIGMCQFGAIGRARAGQRYGQILATYYQGTRLTRLY